MESTCAIHKTSKKQSSKTHETTSNSSSIDSIKAISTHDFTPLQVTPVSPSPPPSMNDEPSSISVNADTPSIFQTIIPPSSIINQQSNESETLPSNSNKRSYESGESNPPSKRSRHSQDSNEKAPHRQSRLNFEDISIHDILLVNFDFNQKKEYQGKCLEKNTMKKQLLIHYQEFDSE